MTSNKELENAPQEREEENQGEFEPVDGLAELQKVFEFK